MDQMVTRVSRGWLVVAAVVAGCGDDDGGSTDAGMDPDAPAPVVRLTVTRKGLPAVGARVVFQDAASNVVRDMVTDLDGSAAAELEAGGYVTLVHPKDPPVGPDPPPTINDKLATFAAVEPGDELRIDLEPKLTTVMVTMTVPPDPGASVFSVTSNCGGGVISQAPSQLTLGDCRGVADFALVGLDESGGKLRGMYREGNPIADQAVVQLTGAWAPLVTSTVMADPAPPWAAFMGIDLGLRSSRGIVFAHTELVDPMAPIGQFMLPPTMGTTGAVSVTIVGDSTMFSKQNLVTWGVPVTDPVIATAPRVLAPYLTLPVWNADTRTVTWTEGAGAKAEVVRAEVHAFRDGVPAHAWDWQLIAPRGAASSVTYPSWPGGGDFDFAPKTGDSTGMRELENISVTGGYGAIRARGLRTRLDVPTLAPAGQLAYQQVHISDN